MDASLLPYVDFEMLATRRREKERREREGKTRKHTGKKKQIEDEDDDGDEDIFDGGFETSATVANSGFEADGHEQDVDEEDRAAAQVVAGCSPLLEYANSKLALLVHSHELNRRLFDFEAEGLGGGQV
eukprot:SAG11_NODE_172_length_13574_cov_14.732690_12_plen_128_part_00